MLHMVDFSIVRLGKSNRPDELDSFDKESGEAEMVRVVVLVTAHTNFLYSSERSRFPFLSTSSSLLISSLFMCSVSIGIVVCCSSLVLRVIFLSQVRERQ